MDVQAQRRARYCRGLGGEVRIRPYSAVALGIAVASVVIDTPSPNTNTEDDKSGHELDLRDGRPYAARRALSAAMSFTRSVSAALSTRSAALT
jgi:hypothetical protein